MSKAAGVFLDQRKLEPETVSSRLRKASVALRSVALEVRKIGSGHWTLAREIEGLSDKVYGKCCAWAAQEREGR